MKRIFYIIFLCAIVLNIKGYVFASSFEKDYIDIRLTNPIKSGNSVKLYSENGFSIFNRDDKLDEVEYIRDREIIIAPGYKDDIDIMDMDYNIIFSYNEKDRFLITSKDGYERKIGVENKYYRDYIDVKIIRDELLVVNHIDVNSYLYGVVPSEMPASFPIDALKAQAIAARSYTLKSLNKHINEGYNLCDTTHCQVYGGISREHINTNTAVDETWGMVITYNGDIIDAVYHSNSGGYTVDSREAWGNGLPYLVAIKDDFSLESPNSSWDLTIDCSQINDRLKSNGINIGEVIDIEIVERSPSSRVSKLKIIGKSGEKILSRDQIRQVLGFEDLKSTWFTIKKEGNIGYSKAVYAIDGWDKNPQMININKCHIIDASLIRTANRGSANGITSRDRIREVINNDTSGDGKFIIEGQGYGHGVGMSQWGAKKMAELGYSYDEILKHYYKGVDITN